MVFLNTFEEIFLRFNAWTGEAGNFSSGNLKSQPALKKKRNLKMGSSQQIQFEQCPKKIQTFFLYLGTT